MSDDSFDDGLVHSHHWSSAPRATAEAVFPLAYVDGARVPSTAAHDDYLYLD